MKSKSTVVSLDKKIKPTDELGVNVWTLDFRNQRIQNEFMEEWHIKHKRLRLIFVTLAVVFSASQIVVALVMGSLDSLILSIIRTFSYIPAFAALLLKTKVNLFVPSIAFCYLITAFTLLWDQRNGTFADSVDMEVNPMVLFTYLMFTSAFKIPYKWAAVLTWINLLALPLLLLTGSAHDPSKQVIAMFLYISCLGMGLEYVYTRELYARKNFGNRKKVFIQDRKLQAERQRKQDLLQKIFPESILWELEQKGIKGICDRFNSASIMFAKLTNIDPKLSAQQVVSCLNTIFSEFDTLTELYEMEKIKTIGSTFMVVGGVPKPSNDHAHKMADLALTLQKNYSVFQKRAGQPNIRLRIGLNVGPVVAGIIGTNTIHYDVWSDAVNIASRMESNALDGDIQVSESMWNALKNDYILEYKGEPNIKGKGKMHVYMLKDRKNGPNNNDEVTHSSLNHTGPTGRDSPRTPENGPATNVIRRNTNEPLRPYFGEHSADSPRVGNAKNQLHRSNTFGPTPQQQEVATFGKNTSNSDVQQLETTEIEKHLEYLPSTASNVKKWFLCFFNFNFSKQLENEFREELFNQSRTSLLLGILVGILIAFSNFLLGLFGNLSQIMERNTWFGFQIVIFLNLLVMGSIVCIPSFHNFPKKYYYQITASFVLINGVFLILTFPEQPQLNHEPSALISIVYSCFFVGVKVNNMIVIAAILAVLGVATTVLFKHFIVPPLLIITTTCAFGLLLNLGMEQELRREFLLGKIGKKKEAQQAFEKQKTEQLLHSVLPSHVAEKLQNKKNKDTVIAEDFNNVTVLVCDIVNFTKTSSVLSPLEVVSFLNEIFSSIERILAKYGLEQIKTVGDAMIVAGPLNKACKTLNSVSSSSKVDDAAVEYARKIAELALEIVETLETPLHIGVHTGPVVAGVIGRKRFTYDIYGETVDIANELAAAAVPGTVIAEGGWKFDLHTGKVYVSGTFKALLPNDYQYEKLNLELTSASGLSLFTLHRLDTVQNMP